ncbi:hypothetical protein [cf. Phormidesmis sp. LEGE 11477]|uniref:hypothetical protein n=1 Tax=cf. Phormidesmis sp. LEGE 11477 TaxID=1828680 RepID=UPI001882CBBA|nr:hypothetical protein [cf. Phormidesmis sp. LEGE 11477]MBE9062247.1 hypothetical protein [cf. Phormidesmis sp. LEGE 11477]
MNHALSLYDKVKLKDWMIAVVGVLFVKECVAVAGHLNQISYELGLAASIAFYGVLVYAFSQVYRKFSPANRMLVMTGVGALLVLLFSHGGPAHAQFLQNAEDFFNTGVDTFGLDDNLGNLIFLIFWLIRGAFVIGVAIALLPAIQAAREGEEWRSLAKTPMIVVGIVLAGATAVDFLVGGVGG